MNTLNAITEQLETELTTIVIHPVRVLLGNDEAEHLTQRLRGRVPLLAQQLTQTDDDKLAAETVVDVMATLFPNAAPEMVGLADWWRTPLGKVCARSLGREEAESVTHSVAAAMLGLSPKSIGAEISRGNLVRHEDGGVDKASVLARLSR